MITYPTLRIQINAQTGRDCQQTVLMNAAYDGYSYSLGSVPFVGGSPVDDETNPLPTKDVTPQLAYKGPWSAVISNSQSTPLVVAGLYSRMLTIQTLPGSTGNIFLRPDGSDAAPDTGIPVFAGGGSAVFGTPALPLPAGNLEAISDDGSPQTVLIYGG